jgi:hypothetical protein
MHHVETLHIATTLRYSLYNGADVRFSQASIIGDKTLDWDRRSTYHIGRPKPSYIEDPNLKRPQKLSGFTTFFGMFGPTLRLTVQVPRRK